MAKSILTVHKEILKKDHAKSPLGILEKNIASFYQEMEKAGKKFPEDIAEKVYDVRDGNEKAVQKYIEDSQRRDREYVDNLLLEAMTKEWNIILSYKRV